MTAIRAILPPPTSVAAIWAEFAADLGPEQLEACYGWKVPPATLRPGESLWAYYDVGDLIGWGSLVKDPTTSLYWYASGIFSAFARQGYRQAIRRHLCAEAFSRGAAAVSLCVLDTNPAHQERLEREEKAGSPWKASVRVATFAAFTPGALGTDTLKVSLADDDFDRIGPAQTDERFAQ